jgi:hypothetical protein
VANSSQQSMPASPLRILNVGGSGVISFGFDHGSYDAYLLIGNQSGCAQNVGVSTVLQDRRGAEPKSAEVVTPPKQTFEIGPYQTIVQLVQIRLAETAKAADRQDLPRGSVLPTSGSGLHDSDVMLPASGILRLVATPDHATDGGQPRLKSTNDACSGQASPGFLDQRVAIPEPPLPSSSRVGYIVGVALLISIIVVAVTSIRLRRNEICLLHRMGSPTWTFGQSWGTNVTIGAGLLGTFLTLLAFPEYPQILDKGSYNTLQALFAAIIAIAPLLYGLIRRDVQANVNGMATTDSQGYVIMFLLAGGLVLWGALGQLTTLGCLIREFTLSGGLARLTGAILELLVLFLLLIVVVYGLLSLYLTAKHLSAKPTIAVGFQPTPHVAAGMPLPEPDRVNHPMPSWPLL